MHVMVGCYVHRVLLGGAPSKAPGKALEAIAWVPGALSGRRGQSACVLHAASQG